MLLFIVAAICSGLINGGCSSSNEEAINTYKEFMDYWIVHDYTRALPYTIGGAALIVEPHTILESAAWGETFTRRPGGYGEVEASKIKVHEESETAGTVYLELSCSASVSLDGSTANPMSPKSWQVFNQTATL